MTSLWRPSLIFPLSLLLRLTLLIYGHWQDHNSPFKYADIDYLVFTDAARYVSQSRSPYDRATYRYTPLLAWLLLPTTLPGEWWFEAGKALFAVGDVVTGWMTWRVLKARGMDEGRALRFASIWLLNPMVANISTRGSSEGLVAVVVVALLWAVLERRVVVAGVVLGFAVHLKIYPFIYAASVFWWLGSEGELVWREGESLLQKGLGLTNRDRVVLTISSLATFTFFNVVMYSIYGAPFIEHSFTYHFTRIDHRHNFSVYNTLLHLSSLQNDRTGFRFESIAFIPQLFLSVVAIPFLLAKKDLASTMLAQTFAFVTFNKVCTSQYFLWYMVFLPFYLPRSTLLSNWRVGVPALVLWVLGQAFWLQQGFELEFIGRSTFFPGLWLAGMAFFLVNCWILGIVLSDIRRGGVAVDSAVVSSKQTK